MFSGFMVDGSNILKFEGVGNVISNEKFAVEWWIFKPKENGQQVSLDNSNLPYSQKF